MRHAVVLAVLLAGCTNKPEARREVLISIGADAVTTTDRVIESDGEVAIVAVDAGGLEARSEQMHERFHRCGGFMVHDSLDDARLSLNMTVQDGGIDYRLDRAALVAKLLPTIDRTNILATIGELSAMPNRYYQSKSGAAASVWLRDRWRSFTTRKDVTIELYDHGYPQKSVIMTIPGVTRPGEVIVIGGHLDSIAPGGTSSNAPGADDDASGIATLSEVARALLAADYRPARTIMFMAYAAEEVGLRGSLSIARDFKKRRINVVGALQLDMTNYQGSDKDIWLMRDFTSPAQNSFLVQLIESYVGATWGWDACGYACSDHAAWHRSGVPASMPFESRMNERNMSIHTKGDTLEKSANNADHAVKFARLGAAYAIELGKGELGGPRQDDSDHDLAWIALGLLGAGALLARRIRRTS